MSRNSRTYIITKDRTRLPPIAFGVSSVLYDRHNLQSHPQESPRSSRFQGHSQSSPRKTKSSPDYLLNNTIPTAQNGRRYKTWNVSGSNEEMNQIISQNTPDRKESGMYDPTSNDIYKRLSNEEHSDLLPPLKSQRSGNFTLFDQDKLREKRYVQEDIQKQHIISKFERDEVFIPSVYANHFACRECRTAYVSKMFTKQYLLHNDRNPKCSKVSNVEKERRHFCDVLGKRFCASCMEKENKKFSKSLHRHLPQKLTDYTHESHTRGKPKKVIGIDLRFASK